MIRNEYANPIYNTAFMCTLFEAGRRRPVRRAPAILGHLQQGGDPSPFDRIQATRLARRCIEFLIEQVESASTESAFIGLQGKEIKFHNMEDFDRMVNTEKQRPKEQWWLELRDIARIMSQPGPD